jgi:arylsulfatase A-like enzyme
MSSTPSDVGAGIALPWRRPPEGVATAPRVRVGAAIVHLAVLSAIAIAQPLFDLLGKNADFFAARGSTRWDIVTFSLGVVLAPALAAAVLVGAARAIGPRVARAMVAALVAILLALVAIHALKEIGGLPSDVMAGLAVALGAGGAVLYLRLEALRSTLTFLAPVPAVVLALFLFGSPVHKLVLESDAGARGAAVASRTPVVMVVFDEFSYTALLDTAGRIDATRYPNFAALARNADVFSNATAPGDITTQATPALLTGREFRRNALPIVADYPRNLFTLLGRSYRMRVSEEATDLCPRRLCHQARGGSYQKRIGSLLSDTGLVFLHVIAPPKAERNLTPVNETLGGFEGDEDRANALEEGDSSAAEEGQPDTQPAGPAPAPTGSTSTTSNSTPGSEADTSSDATTRNAPSNPRERRNGPKQILHELGGGRPARFERWLATVDGSPQPTLYFKHVLLPHVPLQYLPSGRRYRLRPNEEVPGIVSPPGFGNRWLVNQAYQRYLLQVGFVDRLVGDLIARLKREGLYDRSMIVLTADNGESYGHKSLNRHVAQPRNFWEVASTPLIIKRPFQERGRYVRRHVRTMDIVPTIAGVLGIHTPWQMQGHSVYRRGGIPSRMSIETRKGTTLSLPLREYERRVAASVRYKVHLFGEHSKGPGIFGIGSEQRLVGRPVAQLHATRARGLRASLNLRGDLKKVNFASDYVPVHISGKLSGARARSGLHIAVAINGRVVATGWSFRLQGDSNLYFSSMVPETALRAGANDVDVYLIDNAVAGTLERLGGT